ncbi:branched-chain amino acid ABC transporter permease [Polynucleobacter sp. AP-Titi-500A-B4]|uniref:branched-chain amino acid ABC transporter permease n=1 Tax=Polynucleobacter sp. AP-Titi-500A-B4 TaxID=2576923 RepID=UPI001BFE8B8F|nr:branched-chain amino acid ABC transporter permease [Polynucleobacter sp. AP-Titi-500A-B4]QWE11922.1 branched-chain amino acid ABC transporter permease [Polynucleobacter sp. AP-Titi-500A-B4]
MNRIFYIAILLVLLALPLILGGTYYTNLASQILIAAIFAMSLNLLVGYAGLTSLGHAGYLGLAAYISSWLTVKLGWSHASTAAIAIASTTFIAGVFGLIALRATGISFLMITLAFGQILWGLAYRWASVTGGDNGISGITRPSPFGIDMGEASHFYYLSLFVFLLVWIAIAILVRSPFGATIRGTKDQPRRMSALGFNVWLIRWITFTACGFFGSIGGIMYVYYHQFISPHSLSLANSAEMLLMVIAGGAGTLMGPVIGAALVMLLKNVASQYVDHWVTLLGLVFIFIVMFIPGGIVAGFVRIKNALSSAK